MLNFHLVLPEIFVLAMTCIVLLVDLFVKQRQQALTYALTQITLLGAIILTLYLFTQPPTVDMYGLYIHDKLASVLKLAIYISSIFVFLFSRDYMRAHDMGKGEPYLLGLFAILGMMVTVSAYNFITLYLGLELMSLPIYALVALNRDSEKAAEAGIKYFILGAIASGMLLYGLSMVYGATGSLQVTEVAHAVALTSPAHIYILIFGVVFVVAGLAFKIGLVPFHMWLPDVYTGAPNPATLFIAVAPKIAAFGLIVRLLVDAMPGLNIQWQELFIVIAILSMLLGNVVAIVQTNLKRMLAYSTIAHGGYMLLGFAAGPPEGFAASMFYTIAYAIMSLGAFGVITLLAKKGFEAETIDDLRGLNSRNPWLAFIMLLLLFSMAGIPPTIGFFAKLGLLEALVNAHLTWLAVVTLLFAIIGSYYYLRVIKVIYFEKAINKQPFKMAWDSKIGISINGIAILALGIFPSGLITLCRSVFNV
jgi:NADH-quinone oxidoreductase subunit N